MARITGRYILRRLGISAVTLYAIATLLFVLLHAMPGSPVDQLVGPSMTAEQIQNLEQRFGLNAPLWEQYVQFITNYLVFDFGYSVTSLEPVSERILDRLFPTLILFVPAFVLQYSLGTILGTYFGWKRGSKTDLGGFMAGLTLYSIPFFWLGWILLWVFSYQLNLLPSGHMLPPFASQFGWVDAVVNLVLHLTLPVLALALIGWAGPMLVMRTTMQDVVNADYIDFARAQGYPESTVMTRFGARNALIPVVTQAIIGIAFMIDGSVIVETVFSWPGLGKLLVDSVLAKDLPTALAAFYVLGVLIVVLRFLTDIVYTMIDPRIEFGGSD
ncbi:ABC transporter permease [Salarchaeum japonicum]|uniref:ABC transporter permease n=1 Tax=Salarchaeum japonicum TaxID=555573 RepID=A0AAV3T2C4_9EURY|nr:ABC transporter permease [Salarchaeum japonicum]